MHAMQRYRLEGRQMKFDPDSLAEPTLYDLTGNIGDVNTLLINRNRFKRLQPWWVRLRIRLANWRRFKRFRLHM